jgi:hypothetical protein
MTFDEFYGKIEKLPLVPAPPGFRWTSPQWIPCHDRLKVYRHLVREEEEPKLYFPATITGLDTFERPQSSLNQIASIAQEVACMSAVSHYVESLKV